MKLLLRNSTFSFLFEVWYLRRDLIFSVWRFEFDQISNAKHAWRTDLNWMRNCQLSRARNMREEQILIECETVNYLKLYSFVLLFLFRSLHTHRDLLISSRADRWDFFCEIRLFHSCSKFDIFAEIWSSLPEDSNSIKSRARNMREEQILIECETVSYLELETCAKNRF